MSTPSPFPPQCFHFPRHCNPERSKALPAAAMDKPIRQSSQKLTMQQVATAILILTSSTPQMREDFKIA